MINPLKFKSSLTRIYFVSLMIIIFGISWCSGQSALPDNMNASVTTVNYDNTASKSKNAFYFIKEAANDTYGFDIYSNGKIIIDHTSIPGRKSSSGFKSIISAENVAKYIVNRLRDGEGFSAITEEELSKLIVD